MLGTGNDHILQFHMKECTIVLDWCVQVPGVLWMQTSVSLKWLIILHVFLERPMRVGNLKSFQSKSIKLMNAIN